MVHRESASWLFFASSTLAAHWFHAALSSRSINLERAPSTFTRISLKWIAISAQRMNAPTRVLLAHRESATWVFFASWTFSAHWFHAPLSPLSINLFMAPSSLDRVALR